MRASSSPVCAMNALFPIVRVPVEGKILRCRNGLRDPSPANAAKQRFLSYSLTDTCKMFFGISVASTSYDARRLLSGSDPNYMRNPLFIVEFCI